MVTEGGLTVQAIITKYHGPTDTRGSRISATCASGKTSIPYPYHLEGIAAHADAARELCEKLGLVGRFTSGHLPDGRYVFTFVQSETFDVLETISGARILRRVFNEFNAP